MDEHKDGEVEHRLLLVQKAKKHKFANVYHTESPLTTTTTITPTMAVITLNSSICSTRVGRYPRFLIYKRQVCEDANRIRPFIENDHDSKLEELMPNGDDHDINIHIPDVPHDVHPRVDWLDIHYKITGDSAGIWKCYNNCHQQDIYNSILFNVHCKSCLKGLNPYYHFMLNGNDQVDKYPVFLKRFGLIEGKMTVNDGVNVCFVEYEGFCLGSGPGTQVSGVKCLGVTELK